MHHLAIPKLYLEHGGFYPLPCMSYSYYPMNLDLLYMCALYLGSDIVPKFIHFFFALMTAVLIFNYLKKRMDTNWGLWGVFLFLSIPIVIKLSITVYVDLGLIFFTTAALLGIVKWIETDFKVKYLLLAGACCGLAMGTKYNGLIVFFLLTLFVPFFYSRFKSTTPGVQIRAIGAGLIFGLVAFAVFSPWMVRNYIWTGNPVYPLYNNFFDVQLKPSCIIGWENTKSNEPDKDRIIFGRFAYRKFMYDEKWWETALLPIRIFFQGKDNDFRLFDGRLSALLFIFPFFAFIPSHGRSDLYRNEKYIFLVFSGLFILFAMFSSAVRIRYIVPAVPLLVFLSVYGLKNLMRYCRTSRFFVVKKAGSFVLLFSVGLYMIWNSGGYLLEQFKYVKPLSYISGRVSRDAYINDFRHEYAAFQYINEHLPINAKLLFFYIGKRGYYCDRKYFPDEGENINLLYDIIRNYGTPLGIKQSLQSKGVTHFLINNSLFKERINMDLNDENRRLFIDFISMHTDKLFDSNNFSLYDIN